VEDIKTDLKNIRADLKNVKADLGVIGGGMMFILAAVISGGVSLFTGAWRIQLPRRSNARLSQSDSLY
jgi:hypothetical protein